MADAQPPSVADTVLEGIPNDQLMKQFFVELTAFALRFYAGEWARWVLPGTRFELLRQEQLSRILGSGHRIADVVLLAIPPGDTGRLYFLFEGTTHATRLAVYQLAHNALSLGEWLEKEHPTFKLTAVLDIIDPGTLDTTIRLGDDIGVQLHFEARVRRISEMDAEIEVASDNPVAVANVMNMRMARNRRVPICASAVLRLRELMTLQQLQKYAPYLFHRARLDARERLELDTTLRRAEPGMIETLFTDYEKKGRDAGLKEGLDEGRRKGLARGKAESILKFLRARKFVVSTEDAEMIQSCEDEAQLDIWLERAATANSVEEVLG